MNTEIRALSSELFDDYMSYFDNVAFSDHKEWSGCYCIHFHWDSALVTEWRMSDGKKRTRDYAVEYVRGGIIQGYLASMDGNVVGWCNANDKTGYRNLVERTELWDDAERGRRIRSVVCFNVAPHMRGKGIATQLLRRVCQDAAAAGYWCVEAYPHKGENDNFMNHYGPYALYQKCGFALHRDLKQDCIVRRYL
jgi:GNAT superfamily N-acetyltransferase